jgi:uncharacterized protein YdaT
MPWTPKDAPRHTGNAKSPAARRQWSDVANAALKRGLSEGAAVREANAVIARRRPAAPGKK